METAHHVVRLLMGGVFDEFPDLTIVLDHMGEGVPFWLDRLDQVSSRPGVPELRRRPSEYFRDNFVITTSIMFWDPVLLFCHTVLGRSASCLPSIRRSRPARGVPSGWTPRRSRIGISV